MSEQPFSEQQLEDFVLGKLDDVRAGEIQSRANHDPDLRQRLEALRFSIEVVKESERQRLKHVMVAKRTNKTILWIGGGLAAASMALFFWLNIASEHPLYAEYYKPLPETVIMRDHPTEAGMTAYVEGRYEEAIRLLEATGDQAHTLYLGISYMEIGSYDRALATFSDIAESDIQFHASQWYAALSHLGNGDEEACRETLLTISDGSPFHDQALSLLRAMK